MQVETYGPEETFRFGEMLGSKAVPGTVICLDGDLGVGKTVLVKGFAKGLGVTERVSSPTFTIVQEYEGRIPFFHFDVYRIEDSSEMDEIGFDDYLGREGACLIEWADNIRECIPENALWIRLEKELDKGTDYRKITVLEQITGEQL